MALLILLFLKLRRKPLPLPTSVFFRFAGVMWAAGGLVMVRAGHPLLGLLYAFAAWCNWLIGHEASAPGWCRKWLQRLDLHTWHGRFDWLSSWCLLAALATEGPARPWLVLGYLVSAGCRYASRPRTVQVHITGPLTGAVHINLHQ